MGLSFSAALAEFTVPGQGHSARPTPKALASDRRGATSRFEPLTAGDFSALFLFGEERRPTTKWEPSSAKAQEPEALSRRNSGKRQPLLLPLLPSPNAAICARPPLSARQARRRRQCRAPAPSALWAPGPCPLPQPHSPNTYLWLPPRQCPRGSGNFHSPPQVNPNSLSSSPPPHAAGSAPLSQGSGGAGRSV
jgi:hypothetical protein